MDSPHASAPFPRWSPRAALSVSWGGGGGGGAAPPVAAALFTNAPGSRQTVFVVLAAAPAPDSVRAWLEVGGERRAALELLVRGPTLLFRVEATAAEMWTGAATVALALATQSAAETAARAQSRAAWRQGRTAALPFDLALSGGAAGAAAPRWTARNGGTTVFALPAASGSGGFLFCAADAAAGALRVLGLARLPPAVLESELVPLPQAPSVSVSAVPEPEPALALRPSAALAARVPEARYAELCRLLWDARGLKLGRGGVRLPPPAGERRHKAGFCYLRLRALGYRHFELLDIEMPTGKEKGASGGRGNRWAQAVRSWSE